MNDEQFDELIQVASDRPIPSCPSQLESKVLRRIRTGVSQADSTTSDWWNPIDLKGSQLWAVLGLVIALSSLVSLSSTAMYSNQIKRNVASASALDFQFLRSTELIFAAKPQNQNNPTNHE